MATGLGVKIVEELITALIEGSDKDGDFLAGGHDLFAMELCALEFRGGRVFISHDELDLGSRRDLNFARNELVVLQHDEKAGIIGQRGCRDSENEPCGK